MSREKVLSAQAKHITRLRAEIHSMRGRLRDVLNELASAEEELDVMSGETWETIIGQPQAPSLAERARADLPKIFGQTKGGA